MNAIIAFFFRYKSLSGFDFGDVNFEDLIIRLHYFIILFIFIKF